MYSSLILNLYKVGCRNKCTFCAFNRGHGIKERLGAEDSDLLAERELEKLSLLEGKHSIKEIIISGNDPIEYHGIIGFLERIKRATDIGVCFQSHCIDFEDIGFLERALQTGAISCIQVPLYGHTPEIHDSVTQNKGSFDSVMKALGNMEELGFKSVRFQTLFLKQNENHIFDLFSFLSGFGFSSMVSLPCIPRIRGRYLDCHTRNIPDMGKIRNAMEMVDRCLDIGETLCLYDVPFCVSGSFFSNSAFSTKLEEKAIRGYDRFQDSDIDTVRINGETFASYRVLSKGKECKRCAYNMECHGITKPYTDLGIFRPKPFKGKLNFK